MVKQYEATKTVNRLMMWMSRRGMGPSSVLTTRGRRTGESRDVPVTPIEVEGVEYLVAPYGPVSWVKNVRADPNVTLTRGRHTRQVVLTEVDQPDVVKAYYDKEKFSRPYMDVPEDPTVEDFQGAAGQFPVFRIGGG